MSGRSHSVPDHAKFWSMVEKGAPDECWLWTGCKKGRGYGTFQKRRATHVALELDGKPRIANLWALHSCDNPSCVNPSHLRWGTHRENMVDAQQRDRFHKWKGSRRGAGNPKSKLSPEDVRDIRRKHASKTRTAVSIAREYGVGESTVKDILRGITWLT